jgi:hypothetical protein
MNLITITSETCDPPWIAALKRSPTPLGGQTCRKPWTPLDERFHMLTGSPIAYARRSCFKPWKPSREGLSNVYSPPLRVLRIWLLLALALPEGPDRDFLVGLAAEAFAEAWRAELDAARGPRRTSVGLSLEA